MRVEFHPAAQQELAAAVNLGENQGSPASADSFSKKPAASRNY